LQENVHALFADIEAAEHQEERECQGKDLAELGESCEMSSRKLEHLTQALESKLMDKSKDKPLKKAVRKASQGFAAQAAEVRTVPNTDWRPK
jgi:hypothetical protein